jgi:hypothetical protein
MVEVGFSLSEGGTGARLCEAVILSMPADVSSRVVLWFERLIMLPFRLQEIVAGDAAHFSLFWIDMLPVLPVL